MNTEQRIAYALYGALDPKAWVKEISDYIKPYGHRAYIMSGCLVVISKSGLTVASWTPNELGDLYRSTENGTVEEFLEAILRTVEE